MGSAKAAAVSAAAETSAKRDVCNKYRGGSARLEGKSRVPSGTLEEDGGNSRIPTKAGNYCGQRGGKQMFVARAGDLRAVGEYVGKIGMACV